MGMMHTCNMAKHKSSTRFSCSSGDKLQIVRLKLTAHSTNTGSNTVNSSWSYKAELEGQLSSCIIDYIHAKASINSANCVSACFVTSPKHPGS